MMSTRMGRTALLVISMIFFATIALDIAIPAVVLSVMALSNWLVLSGVPPLRQEGQAA